MVVDDDPTYTDIMERFISQIDCLTLRNSFNNPIEAILDIEKNGTPDLLFLDVHMPQIDAFTTIEALDPKPKIIIVSSHWQYEDKLIQEGADKFIQKPITDSKQLEKIVLDVMEN